MKNLNTYINEGLFKNVGIGSEGIKQNIEKWFDQNLKNEFERVKNSEDLRKSSHQPKNYYYINDDFTINVAMYGAYNRFNQTNQAVRVPNYIKINKLYISADSLRFQDIEVDDWESFLPKQLLYAQKIETLRIEETNIDNKSLQNFVNQFFKLPKFRRLFINRCPNVTECDLNMKMIRSNSSTVVSFNGCNVKKLTGEVSAATDLYLDFGWNKNVIPDLSNLKMNAGTYLAVGVRANPIEDEINKLYKRNPKKPDIHSLSLMKDIEKNLNKNKFTTIMGRFTEQFNVDLFRFINY